MIPKKITIEKCALCGVRLHRGSDYASSTVTSRAHATKHHIIAERFFGRTANKPGVQRPPLFRRCPWGFERQTVLFCYECHEELIHNPIFLPDAIIGLAELVRRRGCNEVSKPQSRGKIARRVQLLQEVVSAGIQQLLSSTPSRK